MKYSYYTHRYNLVNPDHLVVREDGKCWYSQRPGFLPLRSEEKNRFFENIPEHEWKEQNEIPSRLQRVAAKMKDWARKEE